MKTEVPSKKAWGWVPAMVLVVGLGAHGAAVWFLHASAQTQNRVGAGGHADEAGDALLMYIAGVGALLSGILFFTTHFLARSAAQLRRSRDALRETEEQFRTSFALAAVGQTHTDPASGRFLRVNHKFAQMLGYSEDELLSMNFAGVTHADDRAASQAALEALVSGRTREATLEKRYIRKDGGVMWARVNAAVVRAEDGRALRMLAVVEDITQQRAVLEQAQRTAREQARQAAELARSNADLADIAHVAAHDLKEPLRGIRHTAAFLLEDFAPFLGDAGREKLERLDRLAKRMHDLLDALLEFGQVGRGELDLRECDLTGLMEDVKASLSGPLAREGARVAVHLLPRVRCDRVLVAQVFANLIINALQYNESGEKRIEIGAEAESDAPVFFVRDNGIGIDPAHSGTIFRMFKRLHTRDRYGGGSGAGLAIAKRIVERHGGRIWLRSAAGEGSTFCFTLGPGGPMPREAGPMPGRAEPPPPARGVAAESARVRTGG